MTRYYKIISVSLFFAFFVLPVFSQQVYPVQVVGNMIPPRSLDLADYTVNRPQDLFFNAILNDPVEPSRQVKLKLTIKQNGQDVYVTDPNFFPTPITLNQFQMETFDGGTLQPYLNPMSLIGVNGGQGSVVLPEGFNHICLEVIDLQREIPISNQFCVRGDFFLNQPPMLQLPICGSELKLKDPQNLLFNWMPMHIGSSNNPGAVEYEFTLVELLPGTLNPNDGFESQLQVYQTTVFTPSLLYTAADPPLAPNKDYAWRVRARSVMTPYSLLFQNEGFSEICTFTFTEDGDQEANLVPPTSCEVFNTKYGPLSGLETVPVQEGDKVNIGFFSMEIGQVFPSSDGFGGTGFVEVPMLNTKIEVKFEQLKVNNDLQVFSIETCQAAIESAFYQNPTYLKIPFLKDRLDEDYMQSLLDYYASPQGKDKVVSKFNLADPTPMKLPLGMDNTIDGIEQPNISVIGLRFTPSEAFITAVASIPMTNGELMRFAGVDIPITPFGVKSNSPLWLLEDAKSPLSGIFSMIRVGDGEKGSGIVFDCEGYQDLDEKFQILVNEEIMVFAEDLSAIPLKLSNNVEEPSKYLGEIDEFDAFVLPGLDGFVFRMDAGQLDLKTDEVLSLEKQPQSPYQTYQNNQWEGLVLEKVFVGLPEEYDFRGTNEQIELDEGTLFASKEGVFGDFLKTNLVDLSDGRMGDWPYSVDTIQISIQASKAGNSRLSGQMRVPILDEPFAYSAELDLDASSTTLTANPKSGNVGMSMWNASFDIDEKTLINATLRDLGDDGKEFFPFADLKGNLSLEVDAETLDKYLDGNKNEKRQRVRNAFGILGAITFEVEELPFKSFLIDPFSPEKHFLDYDPSEEQFIKIGNRDIAITDVHLIDSTSANNEELALQIVATSGNSQLALTIWAKADGKGGFEMDRIETEVKFVECDCVNLEEAQNRVFDLTEILEGYYNKFYAPQKPFYGSIGSMANMPNSLKAEDAEAFYKSTILSYLDLHQINGFLVDDVVNTNWLKIPYLGEEGVKIKVAPNGGRLQSVLKNGIDLNELTFNNIVNNPESDGSFKLPYDLTPQLSDFLGGNPGNIPSNAKLVLTKLDVAPATPEGNIPNETTIELMMVVQIGSGANTTYMRFGPTSTTITPTSVTFGEVDENGVGIGTIKMFMTQDSVEYAHPKYPLKFRKNDSEAFSDGSFAYWSCEGFQKFNVQGEYEVNYIDDPQQAAQASAENTVMAKKTEFSFKNMIFPFIVNGKSLAQFIAPLKTEEPLEMYHYNAEVDKITIKEGYFDMDVQNNVEGFPTGAVPGSIGNWLPNQYTGVYMKEIEMEIIGLFDKVGGARVPLSVEGSDFMYHHSHHMLGKIEVFDLIPQNKEADLGGWPYAIDTLRFYKVTDQTEFTSGSSGTSDANAAGENRNTGTYIWKTEFTGKLLIPLFENERADPNFKDRNWIPYTADLITDVDSNNKWSYGGDFKIGSPIVGGFGGDYEVKGDFTLKWAPGLVLYIDASSSVEIKYNNNEFEPSASLNGTADIAISPQLLPSGVGGDLQMRYSLLKYEGLEINKNPGCGGGSTIGGMKSLYFGNWSIGEVPEEDDDENENQNENEESGGLVDPAQELRNQMQQGINNFPIAVENIGFECRSEGLWKFFMAISLNLSRDPGGGNQSQGSSGLGGGASAVAAGGKSSQRQSAGLKATTQFGLYYKRGSDGDLEFERFGLDAIAIEGKYGPVTMNGFLMFIKKDNPDTTSATQFGDGFKAYVDLQIGGLKGFAFKALGLFGATKYDHVDGGAKTGAKDYRYFFVDIEATMERGIQIPYTPIYVHGLGGGFYYNMIVDTPPINFAASADIDVRADHLAEVTDNTNILIDGPMGELMLPQKTLSQFEYFPARDNFGGSLTAIFSIGNSPKVCFDAVINVGLQVQQSSLGFPIFGLSTVGFNANLYMMAESIANRREAQKGTAIIQYDHNNFRLSGSFNVDFELSLPTEEAKVYGMAVSGEGVLLFQLKDSGAGDSGKWYIKMGRPPQSERINITYFFQISDDNAFEITSGYYGQVGHDLDPMPSLGDLIPNWNGTNNAQRQISESIFANGDGIILGMSFNIPQTSFTFLIFKPWFHAGAGFDLSLLKYESPPPNCVPAGSTFGIKNWYARGQAYFYIGGGVDLYVDLSFPPIKMDVTLLEVQVAAAVQAELPNPAWMKTRVQGNYNVLGGLVSGSFNVVWELGNRCEDLGGDNPFSSIPIISDTDPIENGTDFPIFGTPKVAFNLEMEEILKFEEYDDQGNAKVRLFRPYFNSLELHPKNKEDELVPGLVKMTGFQAYLEKEALLEANTDYIMKVTCSWQEKKNGVWTTLEGGVEKDTIHFRTGAFPNQVEKDHVEYQAPGYSQRYWSKDYAKPLFRFKEEGWDNLFYATNRECQENGFAECEGVDENDEVVDEIAYDYSLKVTEYAGDGSLEPTSTKYIPIDDYPGLVTYEIFDETTQTVQIQIDESGHTRNLQLPTIERITTNGKKVEYSGLQEYINSRIDEVGGQKLYKIELLRIPVDHSLGEVESEEKVLADTDNYSLSIPRTTLSSSQKAGSLKILYRSWFATSKYETYNEKLTAAFSSDALEFRTEDNEELGHPLADQNNTIGNHYRTFFQNNMPQIKQYNSDYCQTEEYEDMPFGPAFRGYRLQFLGTRAEYPNFTDLLYEINLTGIESFDEYDKLRLIENIVVNYESRAEQNGSNNFNHRVNTWNRVLDGSNDPIYREMVLSLLEEPESIPGWGEFKIEFDEDYKKSLSNDEIDNLTIETDNSNIIFRDRRGTILRLRHAILKFLAFYQFERTNNSTFQTMNPVVGLPYAGWSNARSITLDFPEIPKWNFIDEKVKNINSYPKHNFSFGINNKKSLQNYCDLDGVQHYYTLQGLTQIDFDNIESEIASNGVNTSTEGDLDTSIEVFDLEITDQDRTEVSYPVKMGLDYAIGAADEITAIAAYNADNERIYFFDAGNKESDWYKPTGEREFIVNFKQDMPVPEELFWHDNGQAYRPEPIEIFIRDHYPEFSKYQFGRKYICNWTIWNDLINTWESEGGTGRVDGFLNWLEQNRLAFHEFVDNPKFVFGGTEGHENFKEWYEVNGQYSQAVQSPAYSFDSDIFQLLLDQHGGNLNELISCHPELAPYYDGENDTVDREFFPFRILPAMMENGNSNWFHAYHFRDHFLSTCTLPDDDKHFEFVLIMEQMGNQSGVYRDGEDIFNVFQRAINAEWSEQTDAEIQLLNETRMNTANKRNATIYAQKVDASGNVSLFKTEQFLDISDGTPETHTLEPIETLPENVSLEREMILRLRRGLDDNPKMLRIYTLGIANPFVIEGISIDDSQGNRIAHYTNNQKMLYSYSEDGYTTETSDFNLDGGYTTTSDFVEIDPEESYTVYIKSNLGEKIIVLDQTFWAIYKYGRGVFHFEDEIDLFPDAFVSQEGGNHALHFSSDETTNQFVDLTGNGGEPVSGGVLGMPLQEITVEGWFKINEIAQAAQLISFGRSNSASDDNLAWGLRLSEGDLYFEIKSLLADNLEFAYGALEMEHENEWIHLAGTFDGVSLKVYANGTLLQEQVLQNADLIKYQAGGIYLGGAPGLSDPAKCLNDGSMDEIAIWNVARCQEAIIKDMQQGLTGEEEGLWAYYNFDETPGTNSLSDLSGNNRQGSLTEGTKDWFEVGWVPSDVPKQMNNLSSSVESCDLPTDDYALEFDGSPEYVSIPYFSPPEPTMTIEVWIKSIGDGEQIITCWTNSSDEGLVELKLNAEGQPVFMASSSEIITAELALNDDQWHHIAVVLDDQDEDNLQLFVDGSVEGVSTFSGTFPSTDKLTLGGHPDDPDFNYAGQIDEFAVWSAIRTKPQIRNDALKGIDKSAENLELYYDFNHGPKGSELKDNTSNSRNGTLVNMEFHQDWKLAKRPDEFQEEESGETDTNYVLDFDGLDEKVEMPVILDPNAGSFTVTGWINPHAIGNDRYYILTQAGDDTKGHHFLKIQKRTYSKKMVLSTCLFNAEFCGTTIIQPNQWQHIAIVWDKQESRVRLYLNGNEEQNDLMPAAKVQKSESGIWQFGSNDKNKDFFDGELDDFSVWNVALSEEQIINNYVYGVDVENAGADLVSFYDFNDGTGSQDLSDRTESDYEGTLNSKMEIEEDWLFTDRQNGSFDDIVNKPDLGDFWLEKTAEGIFLRTKNVEVATTILEIHAEDANATKKWYRAGHLLGMDATGTIAPKPFSLLDLTALNMAPNGESFSNVYLLTTTGSNFCASNVTTTGIYNLGDCSGANHPYTSPISAAESSLIKVDRIRDQEGLLTDTIQITYRNSTPVTDLDISILSPEGKLVYYLESGSSNIISYQHFEDGTYNEETIPNSGGNKFKLEIGLNYNVLLKKSDGAIASANLSLDFWGELPVIWRSISTDFLPNVYTWISNPTETGSANSGASSGKYQVLRNGASLSLRVNNLSALKAIVEIGIYRQASTWKYYNNGHRFENNDGLFGSSAVFNIPNELSINIAPDDLTTSNSIDNIFVLTQDGSIYCLDNVNTSGLFDLLQCEEVTNPYDNPGDFEEEDFIKIDRLASGDGSPGSVIQITYQNSQAIRGYDVSIYDVNNRLLYTHSSGSPQLIGYQYDAQGQASQSTSDFDGEYEFLLENGKNHMVFLRDEQNKAAMVYLNDGFWNELPAIWKNVADFSQDAFEEYFTSGDYALAFDGIDESVQLTSPPNLEEQTTVCAWIKPAVLQDGTIISWNHSSDPENQVASFGYDQNQRQLILGAESNVTGRLAVFAADNWYHVAVTRASENEVKFYVNGQLLGSSPGVSATTGTPNPSNMPGALSPEEQDAIMKALMEDDMSMGMGTAQPGVLNSVNEMHTQMSANFTINFPEVDQAFIGALSGSESFFNGWIDEVSIWNSALSKEQIQKEYLYGVQTDLAGLMAYYSFNDGPGSSILGTQNESREGQLNNMEVFVDWVESDKRPSDYDPNPYYVEKTGDGTVTLKFENAFAQQQITQLFFERGSEHEHYFDKYHFSSANNSFVCESVPENGSLGANVSSIYLEDASGNYYGLNTIPAGFTSLEKMEAAEVPDDLKERKETPHFFYITTPDVDVGGGGGPNHGFNSFFFDLEMPLNDKKGGPFPDEYLEWENKEPKTIIISDANDPRRIHFNFYNTSDDPSITIAAYVNNRRIYYRTPEYTRLYQFREIDVNEDGRDDYYAMTYSDYGPERLYLQLPETANQAEIYIEQIGQTYKHIYEIIGDACTVDAVNLSDNGNQDNYYSDYVSPDSSYIVYQPDSGQGLAIQFLNSSARNLFSEFYAVNHSNNEIIHYTSKNQYYQGTNAYYDLPPAQSGIILIPDYNSHLDNGGDSDYSLYLKTTNRKYYSIKQTNGKSRINLIESAADSSIFQSFPQTIQLSVETNPNDANHKFLNLDYSADSLSNLLNLAIYEQMPNGEENLICLRQPGELTFLTYNSDGSIFQEAHKTYANQIELPANGDYKLYFKLNENQEESFTINSGTNPDFWTQNAVQNATILTQFKGQAKAGAWIRNFNEDFEDSKVNLPGSNNDGEFALQFDGVNDYLDLGEQTFSEREMSMAVWIKPNGNTISGLVAGIQSGFKFNFANGIPEFAYISANGTQRNIADQKIVEANTWTHLLAVYGENEARFYVNGNLVGTNATNSNLDAVGPFYLGKLSNTYLNAQMDDLRVWNVALDDQEVHNIMVEGLLEAEERLIIHLDMNQGPSFIRANDISKQGFDGLLQNMNPNDAWVDASERPKSHLVIPYFVDRELNGNHQLRFRTDFLKETITALYIQEGNHFRHYFNKNGYTYFFDSQLNNFSLQAIPVDGNLGENITAVYLKNKNGNYFGTTTISDGVTGLAPMGETDVPEALWQQLATPNLIYVNEGRFQDGKRPIYLNFYNKRDLNTSTIAAYSNNRPIFIRTPENTQFYNYDEIDVNQDGTNDYYSIYTTEESIEIRVIQASSDQWKIDFYIQVGGVTKAFSYYTQSNPEVDVYDLSSGESVIAEDYLYPKSKYVCYQPARGEGLAIQFLDYESQNSISDLYAIDNNTGTLTHLTGDNQYFDGANPYYGIPEIQSGMFILPEYNSSSDSGTDSDYSIYLKTKAGAYYGVTSTEGMRRFYLEETTELPSNIQNSSPVIRLSAHNSGEVDNHKLLKLNYRNDNLSHELTFSAYRILQNGKEELIYLRQPEQLIKFNYEEDGSIKLDIQNNAVNQIELPEDINFRLYFKLDNVQKASLTFDHSQNLYSGFWNQTPSTESSLVKQFKGLAIPGIWITEFNETIEDAKFDLPEQEVSSGIDYALQFDGANDYVNLGKPVLNLNTISMGLWVKQNQLHSYRRAILAGTNMNDQGFVLSINSEGYPEFKGGSCYVKGEERIFNKWTQLIAVINRQRTLLYLDGDEVGSCFRNLDSAPTVSENFYVGTMTNINSSDEGELILVPEPPVQTEWPPATNLALRKDVRASSERESWQNPDRIVDGNENGNFETAEEDANAWVSVDLGDLYEIEEIELFVPYNMRGLYRVMISSSNIYHYRGDASFIENHKDWEFNGEFNNSRRISIPVDGRVLGRVVRLQFENPSLNESLKVSEIKVLGREIQFSPFPNLAEGKEVRSTSEIQGQDPSLLVDTQSNQSAPNCDPNSCFNIEYDKWIDIDLGDLYYIEQIDLLPWSFSGIGFFTVAISTEPFQNTQYWSNDYRITWRKYFRIGIANTEWPIFTENETRGRYIRVYNRTLNNENQYAFTEIKVKGYSSTVSQNNDSDNSFAQIDELRVWDTALSEQQVQNIMQNGTLEAEENLIIHLDMNQGPNNFKAIDKSNNGNDGLLNNMNSVKAWVESDRNN